MALDVGRIIMAAAFSAFGVAGDKVGDASVPNHRRWVPWKTVWSTTTFAVLFREAETHICRDEMKEANSVEDDRKFEVSAVTKAYIQCTIEYLET